MNHPSRCPERDDLVRLVQGFLSPVELAAAEVHLADCRRCSQLLDGLDGTDPLLEAARAAGDEELVELQRKADAYVPWLKRLRLDNPGTRPPLDPDETLAPASDSYPAYDFLAPPQADDEAGRLGRFIVRQSLGTGGMGMVFLADDPRLGRSVAVKVIRPDMLDRRELREQFLSEARAIATVEHPNIVSVYEADEANGVPYLVMPLLRGESLEEYADRVEALSIDELLAIGRDLAEGLAAAHERGLIHRDIKPANVFLAEGQPAKILDFGLAQALGAAAENPEYGRIVGTPAYMSPEQALSQPIDARSDLFSLGGVLYRLATGRKPFSGTDTIALLTKVVGQPPVPPSKLRPDLPAEVGTLILKLLEKDANDRPASAREVADAIAAIQHNRARPPRWPWLVGGAAAVLLAVGLTYWFSAGEKLAVPVLVGEVGRDLDCPQSVRDVACAGKGEGFVVLAAGGAAQDASVRAWRANTAEDGKDWQGHDERVFAVALTPDGKLAASGGGGPKADSAIRIWDVAKGTVTATLPHNGAGDITSLALSADGKLLFSGDSKETLTLWDVPGRKVLKTWTDHDRLGVHGVALTADGRHGLSAGGDGRVVLWDVAQGKKLKDHGDHKGEVKTVAFAPDGKSAVSGGSDGGLIVWEIEAGKRRDAIEAHKGGVNRVAFSPDGKRLLSGGADGIARLWEAETGKLVIELKGHNLAVYGVGFSSDGRRAVTGGMGRQLRLWELPR